MNKTKLVVFLFELWNWPVYNALRKVLFCEQQTVKMAKIKHFSYIQYVNAKLFPNGCSNLLFFTRSLKVDFHRFATGKGTGKLSRGHAQFDIFQTDKWKSTLSLWVSVAIKLLWFQISIMLFLSKTRFFNYLNFICEG